MVTQVTTPHADVPRKQKLYCYIDESGQDTHGRLFFVSSIIIDGDIEKIRNILGQIEEKSEKLAKKWSHSSPRQKKYYMKKVLELDLGIRLYYSMYRNARDYVDLTIFSLARAINGHMAFPYTASVHVDGLQQGKTYDFAKGLRQLGVNVRRVRGMRDEGDVLIRLADALAGFVRAGVEGDIYLQPLYKESLRTKKIQKV